jgi:hypothetical protein
VYFQIPLWAVAAVLTFLFLILLSGSWIALVPAICISLLFGLPIDRYVEDRLRELEPLNGKGVAQPTDPGDKQ